MIKALIFDLDGTLVQTEPLKALAHAHAAVEFSGHTLSESQGLAVQYDLFGVSEEDTALAIIQRLGLQEAVRVRMAEFDADTPLQAYLKLVVDIYERMVADPEVIRRERLPYAIALLHEVRRNGWKTALATMSYREQALRVLDVLGLSQAFDGMVTGSDVQRGKPDPEIFLRVAHGLGVLPAQCLVIEDSLPGVQAALAAGMWCIAVPHDLTRGAIHTAHVLDQRWVVDDPAALTAVVQRMLEERKRER